MLAYYMYPPIPTANNIRRLKNFNMKARMKNKSLNELVLTRKQLLLKRAANKGFVVPKGMKVEELERMFPDPVNKKATREEKRAKAEAEKAIKKAEKAAMKAEREAQLALHKQKLVGGPRDAEKYERQFVELANEAIHGPTDVVIVDSGGNKSKVLKNVVRFRVLAGSKAKSPQAYASREYNKPKADIAAVDKDGRDIAWISHKAAPKVRGAIGFNQYLRITGKKLKFTGDARDEVMAFKRAVVAQAPPDRRWPQGKTMWAPIKTKLVKQQAIFGFGFGGPLDRDNVTVFGQGIPTITRKDNVVYLGFSVFSALNGHTELFKGDYEPVYYVRSERKSEGSTRSNVIAEVNGVKYWYLTFFIQPKKAVGKDKSPISLNRASSRFSPS